MQVVLPHYSHPSNQRKASSTFEGQALVPELLSSRHMPSMSVPDDALRPSTNDPNSRPASHWLYCNATSVTASSDPDKEEGVFSTSAKLQRNTPDLRIASLGYEVSINSLFAMRRNHLHRSHLRWDHTSGNSPQLSVTSETVIDDTVSNGYHLGRQECLVADPCTALSGWDPPCPVLLVTGSSSTPSWYAYMADSYMQLILSVQ